MRLHLRAPGVVVVGRALLGVEHDELQARALLLHHVDEALVALLEHGQARRVGADHDVARGVLRDVAEQRLREVVSDLDVGVADQELDVVLGARRRRDVDGDERHALAAGLLERPDEQLGGQGHHRDAVLGRACGGLEQLHLLRPVDVRRGCLGELHARRVVCGRLRAEGHLLRVGANKDQHDEDRRPRLGPRV